MIAEKRIPQEDSLGLVNPLGDMASQGVRGDYTPDELKAMGVKVAGAPESEAGKAAKGSGKGEGEAEKHQDVMINGRQAVEVASQNPGGFVHRDDYYVAVPESRYTSALGTRMRAFACGEKRAIIALLREFSRKSRVFTLCDGC